MQRIALVPYSRDWSYDLTAVALRQHLAHRFDIQVFYRDGLDRARWADFDLVVDFWWRGNLHRKAGPKVAKQVSSHRWMQPRWGSYSRARPRRLAAPPQRGGAGAVKRLEAELAPITKRVELCPKGFHPETFGDAGDRRGELAVGWAGNATAADKNLPMLVQAFPDLRIAGGTLKQAEMPAFYNGVDVITCASDAEGDPRPLIEGMACGCFPVTVDVGIVPELVRHGENGLIVERSARGLRQGLRVVPREPRARARGRPPQRGRDAHLEDVGAVSKAWGDAFDRAIAARVH
jgi:glycosyltransferase involved in cell wall biosynthesis